MKTTIKVLLLTSMILISACYPKPEGFIGLKDIQNPEVSITNLQNGDTISDAMENFAITVQAIDFWGIKKTTLEYNGSLQSLYHEPYNFFIETESLLDTNYAYAIAYDTSDNIAKTDTIIFYMFNTIIVVEPIEEIIMFDNDDPYTINLDNVFMDTINPTSQLGYEISSNSNDIIANVYLDENILTISPNKYREGFAIITLAVSAGDHRTLYYSFNLNVILSELVIKVYAPDNAFRNVLFNDYGFTQFANEDSIVVEEAESLTNLELATNLIYSVEGIQAFVNLDSLKISETELSELNINALSLLEYLLLSHNFNFTEIDLTNNYELKTLIINAGINSLELSQNNQLEYLNIQDSNIQLIDLSSNIAINELIIGVCDNLTQIIFPSTSILSDLRIDGTHNLEIVNLSNLTLLTNLIIHYSSLPSLDISNNIQLEYINLINNEDLIATYVWQLPLPGNVTLYKDDHNILYVP